MNQEKKIEKKKDETTKKEKKTIEFDISLFNFEENSKIDLGNGEIIDLISITSLEEINQNVGMSNSGN